MLSVDSAKPSKARNFSGQMMKTIILLLISLSLLWFSEGFSASAMFEPESTGWKLWVSYANALIQPFAFYFFLCLGERWVRTWQQRALLAFTVPTLLEFGQFLYYRVWTGHYVGAFDPMDIMMYAIGVGLAVIIEERVFVKLLTFWKS